MTTMTLIQKRLSGIAHKHVVTDTSGDMWVYKTGIDGTNEYMGAAVAHLFGVNAPTVIKTDDTWCDNCDDEGAYIKWAHDYTLASQENTADVLSNEALLERLTQACLMACFDAAIGNDDRHDGNWMGREDGAVLAIDNAFGHQATTCTTSSNVNENSIMYYAKSSWAGAFPAVARLSALFDEAAFERIVDRMMTLASTAPVGVGESLMTFALHLQPFLLRWFNTKYDQNGVSMAVPTFLMEQKKEDIIVHLDKATTQDVAALLGLRDEAHFYGVNDVIVLVWVNTWNEKYGCVVRWNDTFSRWEVNGETVYFIEWKSDDVNMVRVADEGWA